MNNLIMYAALELFRMGYPIYALKEGTKQHAFKSPRRLSAFEIQQNMRWRAYNVGIALGDGLMVADCDSQEAVEWCDKNGVVSPMVCPTSRGEHRYFQTLKEVSNKIHFQRMNLDLLFHGYAVAPPSFVTATEHRYTWRRGIVPRSELPLFPQHLLEEVKKHDHFVRPSEQDIRLPRSSNILHPEKYVMQIHSVMGQGGSKALVRAVCKLRDAGRSSEEAYAFLTRTWNVTNAEPPWSDAEIRYSVDRQYSRKVTQ